MGLKAVYRRLSAVLNPPANAQTAHSPNRGALTPNPVKPEKGKSVKKPDSGKPIAGAKLPPPVLNKLEKNPPDNPVAMGAGWAQAIRAKLKGEKKAVAARKKSDRADAARVAQVAAKPTAPFVPRVQFGDFDEDKHPRGHGGKFAPTGGNSSGDKSRETEHIGGVPLHPENIGSTTNPALDAPGTVLGMSPLPGTVSAMLPGMTPADYEKYSSMKAGGSTYTGGPPSVETEIKQFLQGEPHTGVSTASTVVVADGDKVYSGPDGTVHVFKQDSEISNAHREITPNLAPRQAYLGLAAKRPDGTYVKAQFLGPNSEHELRPALFPNVSSARAALAGPKDKIYPRLPYPGDPVNTRVYSPNAQAHSERRKKLKAIVRVSKAHPINPLKIKPPKGSAIAPGKSIGPIQVAPSAMREKK